MVDERFELISLVFRLARSPGYYDKRTNYQQELSSEFSPFKDHPAVEYASKLPLGYDAVLKFAVHITKDGDCFSFIPDIGSLLDDGRWTQSSVSEFLPLLNDFYNQTGFSQFFDDRIPFFEAETRRFNESIYSSIDLEWFRPYVDPSMLRLILALSSNCQSNSATVNDKTVYGAVCLNANVRTVVHEYCHSFANPKALKWYADNDDFRKWCDASVDIGKWPMYSTGDVIAREYVTRAYEVLYMVNNSNIPLQFLLRWHQGLGFPYIEDVYAMITPYVKPEADEDIIRAIFGIPYSIGPEQTATLGDRVITWRKVSLSEPLPYEFQPSVTYCDDIIPSQTGDIQIVDNAVLRFDIGEARRKGNEGKRVYYRIPVTH
jgi:hypothetical protein